MERNREGRRAASMAGSAVPSVTRRPRVKDASDDEDRLEEAILGDSRAWERSKKERLATFHVSAPMNPRNKRKRQGLPHESHGPSGRLGASVEDADESVEETEAAASEDDDEPPPPPLLRRPGKARVHAKEDEIVMDIPAVPRKARSSISSSSRFSSISRRQLEPQPADIPRQKSPAATQTSLNGSSSPNFLQKQGRKLKPVGPKVRAVKVPKVSEPSISDQEVEVAEALFVLARSMPSHAGMLESKVEVKLEAEARTNSPPAGPQPSLGGPSVPSSSLHHAGNIANGYISSHLKDVTGPVAEAPKRKRPRVIVKQEDGRHSTPVRLVTSGAVSSSASPSLPIQSSMGGEMEVDPLPEKISTDAHAPASDLSKVKIPTEAAYPAVSDEKKIGRLDHEGSEQGEFKAPKLKSQSVAEMGDVQSDRLAQSVGAADVLVGNDGPSKGARPVDGLHDDDGSVSKLNIDLMASPMKPTSMSMEEEAPGSSIEKQIVGDNSSAHLEEQSKHSTVSEDSVRAMDVTRGLLKPKERMDAENPESKENAEQQLQTHLNKEQVASHAGRGAKDGEREREVESPNILSRPLKEDIENPLVPAFVSMPLSTSASSSAPVPRAGWMGGLPQIGYYGPGAAPWAAGAALPNPGLDVKAAHSAMQLPPAAILSPVPKMKRCATHVFMAHFIYRDQQARHTLWSAALCRAGPYNLNIPPVNMLDNEKLSGHYMDVARKASTQQSGPSFGYTISQGGGPAMVGSGSTLNTGATGTITTPNHTSGAGVTVDAGTVSGTGTASGNVMAAHAQYLQAMMQQNGFPSFPFPFNGPPGQAPQFFNSPFFPPHLMPPLPHLQPLPQQAGNVLPVQKQQAGLGSLAHPNSSQHVAPALQQQQQQLQLQLAPQSPSQSQQQQQHNHVGISAQQFGMHSDKESMVGNESLSTAESRLTAMQRTMSVQGPSNLPNLNISPSSLMLANNMPAMSSHETDGSPLVSSGGKQAGKSQQQPFQGQSPGSLSSSMQPQQFTAGSGPGLQMKVLDPTLPQGYSAIANRGPVGHGPLGLVSASSMMGTPGHGVLPGSTESSKGHAQQQQTYGGHSQQFQRTINKAPSASEDAYAAKVRDYTDDKKISMKPVGGPQLLSRVDMEVSSPSLQGSPTGGSGASSARMTSVGRTLNSVTPQEVRNSRPASSAGSAQAPLLQNQPQKQAMNRAKAVSGTNVPSAPAAHSVASYAERVLPGNLGKFSGTVLPFSGQMAPTGQSSKPSQAGVVKVGQQRMAPGPAQQQLPTSAMAKTQVQQARSNQPGVPSTPPRMLPAVSAPMLSGGTPSMSSSHSLSVAKGAVVSASKSPSNGKGSTVSVTKAGPPANKKPPVSGPATSSVVSPGQSMSVRAPVQQKSQAAAAHVPQFPQQQTSMASQQQRLATKNQVYPQLQPQQGQYKQAFQAQSPYRPPLFLQQHQQQYMQQPSSQQQQQQQQAVPQHAPQLPVSHHYQTSTQNLPAQHGQAPQHSRSDSQLAHIQQQFQPVSSSQPSAANNNLSLSSPNLTLGTAMSGNMSSSASSDGADQFKGANSRTNPPKSVYTSGNPLPSGGMSEIMTTAHPAVSGQVSSPQCGSSHYLQLAPVKPSEQKPLPDVASREDMNSGRHLASPSSQAVAASNPSSS